MDEQRELMALVIGWTCVGVFVSTAVLTVLSLARIVQLEPSARKHLYQILIFEIVAISIGTFSGLLTFNPERVATKIETLEANAARAVSPPDSAAPQALAARVYFRIQDESQRAGAQQLAARLVKSTGVIVPVVQIVKRVPSRTELRYFRQTEEAEAKNIADAIRSLGSPVVVKYVSGFETSTAIRPRHYELWLAK